MRCLLLIFFANALFGQKAKLDTVFCDCEFARTINLAGNNKVGKTIAPIGPGQNNELGTTKNRGKYIFDKEHHTAWYKLVIATNGKLVFDIIPTKITDDYDFVLFKATTIRFCDSLSKHRIVPIRSCISRDKEDIQGKTGLSMKASKDLVKTGVGDAYAKYVQVSKGEIYYLVLDNVYKEGDGHTIQFSFEELVKIAGVVKDEDNQPIIAEIAVVNQKGDTVALEKSNVRGEYSFIAPLRRNMNYNLTFYNDQSFSYSKNIKIIDSIELKHISLVLPKLKKGKKHAVGSINFYPGETRYLPVAIPSMMNLFKLMQRNPGLKIRIIGHSNGRSATTEKEAVQFTLDRAATIQGFLVRKGISKDRLEIDGKADHEMLFALPDATEKQQEMNRRVEIMVLEY